MTSHAPVISVGFVGCGRATTALHLPALRTVPGVTVAALADVDPAAFVRASALVPGARTFADYRALLELPGLDAVAVCVPAAQHAELGRAVLAAGRHLFVEKPLALTLEDCDRLIERSAESQRTVMVGFNARHHRLIREARALLRDGGLGPLELIRSVLTSSHESVPEWRKARATGGGVLLELAVHHYDLWRFLTGEEVAEVSAFASGGRWEDESATVIARLSSGAIASGAFSQRTSQNNSVEVCGRAGSLTVSLYRFDGLERAPLTAVPGDVGSRIAAGRRLLTRLPRGIAGLRRGGEWAESYRAEWLAFAAALRGGGPAPAHPGAPPSRGGPPAGATLGDGRAALAIALAAAESAATGRSVRVAGSVQDVE